MLIQIESEKSVADRIFLHMGREGLPNSISTCVRLIGGDKRQRVKRQPPLSELPDIHELTIRKVC